MKKWELIKSSSGPSFRVFSVRTDTTRSPVTSQEHDFYVIETQPCANILALTARREIVMVRQYRHGIREFTLELPGGLVENGISPEETAKKELLEETGFQAKEAMLLGQSYPQPAILNQPFYCFLAESVEKVSGQNLESTEDIEVVLLPLEKVPTWIKAGKINHSLAIAAFFYYFDRKKGFDRDK